MLKRDKEQWKKQHMAKKSLHILTWQILTTTRRNKLLSLIVCNKMLWCFSFFFYIHRMLLPHATCSCTIYICHHFEARATKRRICHGIFIPMLTKYNIESCEAMHWLEYVNIMTSYKMNTCHDNMHHIHIVLHSHTKVIYCWVWFVEPEASRA